MKKLILIFAVFLIPILLIGQETYDSTKTYIDNNINTNGSRTITGAKLNNALTLLNKNQANAEYDTTRTYTAGQFCIYNNNVYQADTTTTGAFTLSDWTEIAGQTINWSLNGNSVATDSSDFIGPTNNVSMVFKTNNTERMRIRKDGNIGIGVTNPTNKLSISGDVNIGGYALDHGTLKIGAARDWNLNIPYIGVDIATSNQITLIGKNKTTGSFIMGSVNDAIYFMPLNLYNGGQATPTFTSNSTVLIQSNGANCLELWRNGGAGSGTYLHISGMNASSAKTQYGGFLQYPKVETAGSESGQMSMYVRSQGTEKHGFILSTSGSKVRALIGNNTSFTTVPNSTLEIIAEDTTGTKALNIENNALRSVASITGAGFLTAENFNYNTDFLRDNIVDTLFSLRLGSDSLFSCQLQYNISVKDADSAQFESGTVHFVGQKNSGTLNERSQKYDTDNHAVNGTLSVSFDVIKNLNTLYFTVTSNTDVFAYTNRMGISWTLINPRGNYTNFTKR